MIISKKSKSMVYHRPECRYAQKIQNKNTRQVEARKAIERGWRPCKCCDCASFLYKLEKDSIEAFKERHNIDVDLADVEAVQYHSQDDIPYSKTIMSYLEYIQKHDYFKQHRPTYLSQMPQSTEKQKQYYRAAKKRDAKRSAKRVDYLFRMLEKEEGMKKLSFC